MNPQRFPDFLDKRFKIVGIDFFYLTYSLLAVVLMKRIFKIENSSLAIGLVIGIYLIIDITSKNMKKNQLQFILQKIKD